MANSAIGIDLGHSCIKLIEVRRRGRQVHIKRAMLLPLPPGAMADGVIMQPEAFFEVLDGVAPAMRMERTMVVAGIIGQNVSVRTGSVPDAPPAEMYPLVVREFCTSLRLQPEEEEHYYIDYLPLPTGSSAEKELLIAGIKRENAIAYADVLRSMHLAPHILDIQAFALPRSLPVEGRACYIDIGADHTQILITTDGHYHLYRLLPIGMRRLQEEVAKAYSISNEEALLMQQEQHIDLLMIEAPGQRGPIQAVVDEMVGGIIQTLEFVRARQRAVSVGELLSAVLLTGGGAMQKGMDILLSEEIGIQVSVAHPFLNYSGTEQLSVDILRVEPLFAGALGLAQRGLDE